MTKYHHNGAILRVITIAVISALAVLTGCDSTDNSSEKAKVQVYVDIAPLEFFVKEISGGKLLCKTLIPAGQDPHTFQPTIKQISEISEAEIFISAATPLGSQIAEKLGKSNPDLQTLILFEHITPILAGHDEDEDHDHDEHAHDEHDSHDEHHHHNHSGPDPHFWMSARNAFVMTDIIADTLSKLHPEQAELFSQNAAKLKQKLTQLDDKLTQTLSPLKGKAFYVFHPAFGYFARDYGLIQKAVEFEGKSPSPRKLNELIESARAEGVRVIFTQPQFSPAAAQTIAEQIGGAVIPLDPLSSDYLNNLELIATKIQQALGGGE